jgi:hypothetical protein
MAIYNIYTVLANPRKTYFSTGEGRQPPNMSLLLFMCIMHNEQELALKPFAIAFLEEFV